MNTTRRPRRGNASGGGPGQHGVTLIELLIFIVVIAISVTGVLLAFAATERGGPTAAEIGEAEQLAQERMELILAHRPVLGFNCFNASLFDPCGISVSPVTPCPGQTQSTAPICTSFPQGFSIVSGLVTVAGSPQKTVTVQVSGPQGQTLALLTSEVDEY